MEEALPVEQAFDPKTIDINHKNINPVFARTIVDGEATNTIRINWVHDYSDSRDTEANQRPAWAYLPIDERVFMELPDPLVNAIVRRTMQQPNRLEIELPCPPYEYTIEDGRLQIKSGGYVKSGTKAEWQAVIKQMQAEVEEMPDGIDTTDLPDITIQVNIKSSTTVDVSVQDLLEGSEQYDGELFVGDKTELEDALERALEDYEVDEYNTSMSDAYIDEIEAESNDLSYCMQQVDG